MKANLLTILFCLTLNIVLAQADNTNFQDDPKLVLEEIFRAAKTNDFSKLHLFCPKDGSNDGDTQKYICEINSASEKGKAEFVNYFKDGRITGEVKYSTNETGKETASVPFWFNHPSGGDRCNENMEMAKIDGKWYLVGF